MEAAGGWLPTTRRQLPSKVEAEGGRLLVAIYKLSKRRHMAAANCREGLARLAAAGCGRLAATAPAGSDPSFTAAMYQALVVGSGIL